MSAVRYPFTQDNVSHLRDEVDNVIWGLEIDWILHTSLDPGGLHSEALGSIDVGNRIIPDEHDLLGARESCCFQGITEYPRVRFGITGLFGNNYEWGELIQARRPAFAVLVL